MRIKAIMGVGLFFVIVLSGLGVVSAEGTQEASVENVGVVQITVYRSPTCGCCGQWIEHLKAHAFVVNDIVTNDMDQVKERFGISPELASCHTARVAGYFIEGHVPADDITRLLTEKPAVKGLTVPGMPRGAPGMEMGAVRDDFDVYVVGQEAVKVFNQYRN
ncbi:MAG TPA: DUF411 domain-containing protein [Methylococcaceae bacterium]|nr:DUF411 domain-containing protein [Methylococcaceae bacterium]HIN68285.1 DUF411 domain-containing protein [Methylococcales bacterium]HIA45733.1 DUF411 domain-containing protein [Methylococcaceae bacterium]HIB63487.1 DUF411 domain-containing protein [Methylococcaceae bacterium]HIO12025.1 DUF411 domain-containing protein [Methylococcales bacterium]